MDELLSWLIKASKIHKPGFYLPRERAQVAVFPRLSEFVVVRVYLLASLLTVTDENRMPRSTCKFFSLQHCMCSTRVCTKYQEMITDLQKATGK